MVGESGVSHQGLKQWQDVTWKWEGSPFSTTEHRKGKNAFKRSHPPLPPDLFLCGRRKQANSNGVGMSGRVKHRLGKWRRWGGAGVTCINKKEPSTRITVYISTLIAFPSSQPFPPTWRLFIRRPEFIFVQKDRRNKNQERDFEDEVSSPVRSTHMDWVWNDEQNLSLESQI